jgi:hypothetical protein
VTIDFPLWLRATHCRRGGHLGETRGVEQLEAVAADSRHDPVTLEDSQDAPGHFTKLRAVAGIEPAGVPVKPAHGPLARRERWLDRPRAVRRGPRR